MQCFSILSILCMIKEKCVVQFHIGVTQKRRIKEDSQRRESRVIV